MRNPENTRAAALLLKAATLQKDWAIALLNTQVKVDERSLSTAEEEASERRAAALCELAEEVRKRSAAEAKRSKAPVYWQPQMKNGER